MRYTLKYASTTLSSNSDMDGLITRLAIDGIPSTLTDNVSGLSWIIHHSTFRP